MDESQNTVYCPFDSAEMKIKDVGTTRFPRRVYNCESCDLSIPEVDWRRHQTVDGLVNDHARGLELSLGQWKKELASAPANLNLGEYIPKDDEKLRGLIDTTDNYPLSNYLNLILKIRRIGGALAAHKSKTQAT